MLTLKRLKKRKEFLIKNHKEIEQENQNLVEDLKYISEAIQGIDKIYDDELAKLYNVKTKEELVDYLTNKKNEIELECKRIKMKNDSFLARNISQLEILENSLLKSRKSIIWFWVNFLYCFLSILTGAIIFEIGQLWIKIVVLSIWIIGNIFMLFKYIKAKTNIKEKAVNLFDFFQPFTYLQFAYFIEVVCLLISFNIQLDNKVIIFYFSLFLNVSILTCGIGSIIKSLKLTYSNLGALALALSTSLFIFILEENLGLYMPIPKSIVDAISVITCIIWLFVIVYNYIFLSNKEANNNKKPIEIFALFIEIMFSIILSIYTIYSIFYNKDGNNDLFNGIMTVFASIYGGGLTLAGVAWTIKNQDKIRREEEKIKMKPYINYVSMMKDFKGTLCDSEKLMETVEVLIGKNDKEYLYETVINDFIISNTNMNPFNLTGVIINDKYIKYKVGYYIEKDKLCLISFNRQVIFTKDKVEKFSILIEDLRKNEYEVVLGINYNKTREIKPGISIDRKWSNKKISLNNDIEEINVYDVINVVER